MQDQQPNPSSQVDELTRVFNTALISSRAQSQRDFSNELYALMGTQAFQTILSSIRLHACTNAISDAEAAEAIIETFRKVDRIWSELIVQEGVDRLSASAARQD